MKLSHLRDVIAAAECGSLRAAARQLGVAQPAITRSIREIEAELGVPLFERHQQGVRLTPMGQTFLRRAEAAQTELRRAREEIAQLRGEMRGQVAFGISAVSTLRLMPSALRAFRQRFPLAIIKMSEGFFHSFEPGILNGQLDFYVGPHHVPPGLSRVHSEALFHNDRAIICRKGHPMARAESLRDLAGAEWIKQTLTDRGTEADFERAFEQHGLPPPQVVLHATSATATLMAVAASDLLTIVPAAMLSPPLDAGLFEVIGVKEQLSTAPICLVRRNDMPLTPLAETMSDLIRRAAVRSAGRN